MLAPSKIIGGGGGGGGLPPPLPTPMRSLVSGVYIIRFTF